MNIKHSLRCFACVLLLLVTGCTEETPASSTTGTPEKIVVISPAIAEMLASLGLAGRVVGIGQYGPWPETLAELPVAGGYNNPNVEQVIRLGADAVINVKSEAAEAAHRRLRAVGVHVWSLDTSTYQGIFDSLQRLGEIFNRETAAQNLIRELQQDMNTIHERTRDLEKPRVLFVVGREPLYVAGPGSHIDTMIKMAGGSNVAHDTMAPYQQISVETILQRKPQVIIDASRNQPDALRGRHAGSWRQWPFLPAVENDQVYWIDPSRLLIPGIRIANMTRLIGKLIHPQVFGEPTQQEFLPGANPHVSATH